MNTKGNLKDYIQEMEQKSNKIMLEINVIGTRSQVETEETKGKLKLFETSLMPEYYMH